MECGGKGKTILMLHKIPHFRELIIASFKCGDCKSTNNEVTFGGEIQPKGSIIELLITSESDLNRQLIKSDSASVLIKELEFEIPPGTQKGEISTIEGILTQAIKNLQMYQPERLIQHPEVGAAVALVIMNLMKYVNGDVLPFTIVLDDCSGNSFIENTFAPKEDPNMKLTKYNRTPEQDLSLGLEPAQQGTFSENNNNSDNNYDQLLSRPFGANANEDVPIHRHTPAVHETEDNARLGKDEVIVIGDNCPNCAKLGEFRSAMTSIPHFKEVLIMSFHCVHCGYRTNEVKGGGAIPEFGQQIELNITSENDFKRDVLKGDSAALYLPAIDLELSHGSLGGVYTTVEGLLNKVYTNLRDNNPFAIGDSMSKHHSNEEATNKKEFVIYLEKLKLMCLGDKSTLPFKLIIHDPLGNSFISAPLGSFLPPESDINLNIIEYKRTEEEEDEFGITDMNTKDFETVEGQDIDEYYNPKNILSDRLTHILPKEADHPRAFAQGTADNTAGGYESTTKSKYSDSTNSVVPEGFKAGNVALHGMEDFPDALRLNENDEQQEKQQQGQDEFWSVNSLDLSVYSKRHFIDDSALADQFDAREEFAGRRDGCVYRLGSLGLGYYPDVRK